MIKEAIILAGGFGTRLKGVTGDVPKPLAPVGGRPFLEYLLEHIVQSGIGKVIMAVGYKFESIMDHFGEKYNDIDIAYSVESEPLGTGGAILQAVGSVTEESCLVVNGDTFFPFDMKLFQKASEDGDFRITVALKEMMNFDRYGTVETEGNRIVSFHEKKYCEQGMINAGAYIVDKAWLKTCAPGKVFSFEKEILETHVGSGLIGYYLSDAWFIDIGIPEDYEKANRELPRYNIS